MSNLLTKIAHNNRISIGPKDTKLLAEVISTEKRAVESTVKVAGESNKAAVAIKEWGQAEGPDLSDILSKVSVLLEYLATAQQTFAEHNNNFRIHFKNIRTREENLAALKRSHTSLAGKIEAQDKKVSRMKEENKDLPAARERLNELRQEMVGLENSVINEETKLGDYKRSTAREALSLKLGALLEMAEKSVIIGEIGKLIVDEIPTDRTEPGAPRAMYHGYDRTDELMAEANRCLQDVVFNPMPISSGNPPSAALQRLSMHKQQQQQQPQEEDDIRRVGGPTYAGSYPMNTGDQTHSRGNSQSQDGSHYLPNIAATAPLDERYASAQQQQQQQQQQGGLGAPVINDYRSSLAYMGTTDDHHYNEVLDRERKEAEDEARNAENTWARPDAPTDATRQEPEPVTVASPSYMPRSSTEESTSRAYAPPGSSVPLAASNSQNQMPHAPQHSSPLAAGSTTTANPNERPYIPKENDGAYHGPRPDQPPPRVVTPTFGTAPSSPLVGPSSAPPAPSSSTTAAGKAAATTTKPPMVRGESALGSKHGDIYVAGRTDGPQQFSTGGPVNVPGAPFVPPAQSGYNNNNNPSSAASFGSSDPNNRRGVINAGAFRRGGPSSAGYAPPSGYDTRFAAGMPGAIPEAPSPADKIRDQYRAAYAEEAAGAVPLDGGASAAPRFDTTPLNPTKRMSGQAPPTHVQTAYQHHQQQQQRPATTGPGPSDPAAWNDQVALSSPVGTSSPTAAAIGSRIGRPMTPVANEPPTSQYPTGAGAGAGANGGSPAHYANQQHPSYAQQQQHQSPGSNSNYGVVQAVTRLD